MPIDYFKRVMSWYIVVAASGCLAMVAKYAWLCLKTYLHEKYSKEKEKVQDQRKCGRYHR